MKKLLKILLLFMVLTLSTSVVRSQSTDEFYQQAKASYDKKDYEAAFPLMLKAAKNNHPNAQVHVGIMYGLGLGREVDSYEAVKWYKKAAEQGYKEGEYNLGIMYRDGKGVKSDYSLAIYYFRKASKQNHMWASACLGYMVENGQGCTKNFDEAIGLYQKAARLGDKWSQDRLTQLGYSW